MLRRARWPASWPPRLERRHAELDKPFPPIDAPAQQCRKAFGVRCACRRRRFADTLRADAKFDPHPSVVGLDRGVDRGVDRLREPFCVGQDQHEDSYERPSLGAHRLHEACRRDRERGVAQVVQERVDREDVGEHVV
jgi:hypothetical protein